MGCPCDVARAAERGVRTAAQQRQGVCLACRGEVATVEQVAQPPTDAHAHPSFDERAPAQRRIGLRIGLRRPLTAGRVPIARRPIARRPTRRTCKPERLAPAVAERHTRRVGQQGTERQAALGGLGERVGRPQRRVHARRAPIVEGNAQQHRCVGVAAPAHHSYAVGDQRVLEGGSGGGGHGDVGRSGVNVHGRSGGRCGS